MNSGQDKPPARVYPRARVKWQAACHSQNAVWMGQIRDVSAGGAFFEPNLEFANEEMQTTLRSAFVHDDKVGLVVDSRGVDPVQMEGVVRWIGPHSTYGCQGIGVEFFKERGDLWALSLMSVSELVSMQKHSGSAEFQRLTALTQKSSDLIHEVANSFTSVLMNLEYLDDCLGDQAGSPQHTALSDALEGARHVSSIIGNARSDENERANVDLNEAVRAALRMCGPKIRGGTKVSMTLAEEAPVNANATQLVQVFLNLISNAVDAMKETTQPELSILTCRDSNRVYASVGDTGHGIPSGAWERVFERFFTTKGSGTGLGLHISRRIIRHLGGELGLESSPTGTVFSLCLPVLV
ncbi:ATP-binding protein [Myxococcota bacterium]